AIERTWMELRLEGNLNLLLTYPMSLWFKVYKKCTWELVKPRRKVVAAACRQYKFTDEQVTTLEQQFRADHKLDSERKLMLASELGLDPCQVAVSFQNRIKISLLMCII
ncbi:homeobox-leucine zipper protein ATHB-40-like protein, partial [Tanacetum coccineum]